MRFTLGAMAALPCCRSLPLGKDAFLLATGTDSASENWAFVPEGEMFPEALEAATRFFSEPALSFIWPILPGSAPCSGVLEDANLPLRGSLLAMTRAIPLKLPKVELSEYLFEVTTPQTAAQWAETAWQSFDSPPGAPLPFVHLAQGLAQNTDFLLVNVILRGLFAGSYLLSFRGSAAGLYYFAVMPALRRKGVARAMMEDLLRRATERGAELLTLQATPAGRPFYAAQGFEPLFEIAVHSASLDIF